MRPHVLEARASELPNQVGGNTKVGPELYAQANCDRRGLSGFFRIRGTARNGNLTIGSTATLARSRTIQNPSAAQPPKCVSSHSQFACTRHPKSVHSPSNIREVGFQCLAIKSAALDLRCWWQPGARVKFMCRDARWRAAFLIRGFVAALILGTLAASAIAGDDRAAERHQMVEAIERMRLSVGGDVRDAVFDPRVLAALRSVPRHEFVPHGLSSIA